MLHQLPSLISQPSHPNQSQDFFLKNRHVHPHHRPVISLLNLETKEVKSKLQWSSKDYIEACSPLEKQFVLPRDACAPWSPSPSLQHCLATFGTPNPHESEIFAKLQHAVESYQNSRDGQKSRKSLRHNVTKTQLSNPTIAHTRKLYIPVPQKFQLKAQFTHFNFSTT